MLYLKNVREIVELVPQRYNGGHYSDTVTITYTAVALDNKASGVASNNVVSQKISLR
jgi:hypothetical protein